MDEEYKRLKREQHQVYEMFLYIVMACIVVLGGLGLFAYFGQGKVEALIISAIGIIVAILIMTSNKVKSTMIYDIRGE